MSLESWGDLRRLLIRSVHAEARFGGCRPFVRPEVCAGCSRIVETLWPDILRALESAESRPAQRVADDWAVRDCGCPEFLGRRHAWYCKRRGA